VGLARWVYLTTLNVLNRSLRADLFVARFPLLGVLFLACSSHQKVDGMFECFLESRAVCLDKHKHTLARVMVFA